MMDKWIKWEPIEELRESYNISDIIDDGQEFTVLLSTLLHENNKELRVTFKNCVEAYRSTRESFRLETVGMVNESINSKECELSTLFKVTNSSYIKLLAAQSNNTVDTSSFIHFAFYGVDLILDVIATADPQVENITNG